MFYVVAPSLPAQVASHFRPLYLFLLNKWYFDELYDAVLVRPSMALARVLWQVGDATIIDGVPNGLATLTADGSAQAVKLQTGSIAVYAFAMLIGLVRAGHHLLSCSCGERHERRRLSPAVAASPGCRWSAPSVIMSVRGDEATVASNARWTALWTSLIVFVLSLVLWVRFDPADPASSSSRTVRLAAAIGHRLQAGRGRHFRAVRPALHRCSRRSASWRAGRPSPSACANTCSPSWCWKP